MHCIFPMFIIFSSYWSFLFASLHFSHCKFWSESRGLQAGSAGIFFPGSFSPCIFHVPITLGAINTN